MRRAILVFLCAAGAASPISAEPNRVDKAVSQGNVAPRPTRTPYGWQIVLADVAAAGAWTVSIQSGVEHRDRFADAGRGMFWFGGPVIHAGHNRGRRSLASLGLRFALPTIGMWAGTRLEGPCMPNAIDCGQPVVGPLMLLTGVITAAVIDWRVLSRDSGRF